MRRDFFAPAAEQATRTDRITQDNEAPLGHCGQNRGPNDLIGCGGPLTPSDYADYHADHPGCILP